MSFRPSAATVFRAHLAVETGLAFKRDDMTKGRVETDEKFLELIREVLVGAERGVSAMAIGVVLLNILADLRGQTLNDYLHQICDQEIARGASA